MSELLKQRISRQDLLKKPFERFFDRSGVSGTTSGIDVTSPVVRLSRGEFITAMVVGGAAALTFNLEAGVQRVVSSMPALLFRNNPDQDLLFLNNPVPAPDYAFAEDLVQLAALKGNGFSQLGYIRLEQILNKHPWLGSFLGSLDGFFTPSRVEASDSEMILGREAYSTRNFWPLFNEAAIRFDPPLPKMQDDGQPAHVLDMEYQAATGQASNKREQAEEKVVVIGREQPHTKRSAGYCPFVSVAQVEESKPQAFPGEVLGGATDPDRIVEIKEGLQVLIHTEDIFVPVPVTTQVMAALVELRLTSVVDAPAGLGSGNWFRSLLGRSRDGALIRVTNFGLPHQNIPLSAAIAAYVVYPGDSKATFKPGIKESTSFWRFNNLDMLFIRWLIAGKP